MIRDVGPGVAEAYVDLRPLLFSIAYRMLGSVGEAEDIVQETLLRAWRNAHRFSAARADEHDVPGAARPSLRPWLVTVARRIAASTAARRIRRTDPAIQPSHAPPRPSAAQGSRAIVFARM